MKEYGYPRPSCEQCGRPELNEEEALIWGITNRYFRAITKIDGFGGWSLDLIALKMIADEFEINPFFNFAEKVLAILNIRFKIEEKEDKEKKTNG